LDKEIAANLDLEIADNMLEEGMEKNSLFNPLSIAKLQKHSKQRTKNIL